jgi:hypothetical protein
VRQERLHQPVRRHELTLDRVIPGLVPERKYKIAHFQITKEPIRI